MWVSVYHNISVCACLGGGGGGTEGVFEEVDKLVVCVRWAVSLVDRWCMCWGGQQHGQGVQLVEVP